MPPTAANESRRRRGFTLIELLVVIVILGVLIGLLLPAIGAAVRAARAGAVQAEITQLATALSDFKSKFGDYPPSRIILNEGGCVFPSNPASGPLYQRTMVSFRKFWPRVQLGIGAAASGIDGSTNWYDFNGNGTYDGEPVTAITGATSAILQGHQCLAFFLGGIPQPDLSNAAPSATSLPQAYKILGMSGFARNPQNPFFNNQIGKPMYSGNRNPPLFEFNNGRLSITAGDVSGMPGYLDSLNSQSSSPQNFLVYFSTNNGTGYDPHDVDFNNPDFEVDGTGTHPLNLTFGAGTSMTVSASPNPYTTGQASVANVAYFNPQSFQIISPGSDGAYGLGGYYNPNASSGSLPIANMTTNSNDPNVRSLERDNLTNFHNGKLE